MKLTSSCVGLKGAAVVFLFLLVLLPGAVAATPEVQTVTLCQEVHGFAGEYNDHFKITIQHDPSDPTAASKGEEEAVVLVARAFPVGTGTFNQNWLAYNATYVNAKGAKTVTPADGNGILRISSVAADTQVEVWVNRLRLDGPVPFRFFSYHSNYPGCFIPVSPTNSFVALIPRLVRDGSSVAARIYFETTLPKDLNAFVVKEAGTGGSTGVYVLSADQKAWEPHAVGQAIVGGAGKTVRFSYVPSTSASDPYVYIYLTVEFTREDGGSNKGTETSAAPDKGGPVPGGHTSTSSKGLKGFFAFAAYGFAVLVVYFMAGSYYNYSRNGMREFPEMVPHIDALRTCLGGCASYGSHLRHGERYGGYSSVRGGGGAEMDNPYNL